MKVIVSPFSSTNNLLTNFEIVERKGIGHPDTLSDAIAEQASRYYSQYCLENFGRLAHHWFDKVMLIGGKSEIRYGYGKIVEPFTVIFAGKSVKKIGTTIIPLDNILYKATSDTLSKVLYNFNPVKHLKIENRISSYIGPGQKDSRYNPSSINQLIEPTDLKNRVSNDCNICVGYAPFTILEKLVLEIEKLLNSVDFKNENNDTGSDIKIVGTRYQDSYELLINLPMIASLINNNIDYINRINTVEMFIKNFIKQNYGPIKFNLIINPEKETRPYLTVTGTVADTGDIGVVGRGNRVNGLITPMRMMSIEAASGKNPIDHTGKLYSVLAFRLAESLYNYTNRNVNVVISTSKEKPICIPDYITVQIEDWQENADDRAALQNIINLQINSIHDLTNELVNSEITLW